jgi:hypothetical protein
MLKHPLQHPQKVSTTMSPLSRPTRSAVYFAINWTVSVTWLIAAAQSSRECGIKQVMLLILLLFVGNKLFIKIKKIQFFIKF